MPVHVICLSVMSQQLHILECHSLTIITAIIVTKRHTYASFPLAASSYFRNHHLCICTSVPPTQSLLPFLIYAHIISMTIISLQYILLSPISIITSISTIYLMQLHFSHAVFTSTAPYLHIRIQLTYFKILHQNHITLQYFSTIFM